MFNHLSFFPRTGCNLRSHKVPAPLTRRHFQVTCHRQVRRYNQTGETIQTFLVTHISVYRLTCHRQVGRYNQTGYMIQTFLVTHTLCIVSPATDR